MAAGLALLSGWLAFGRNSGTPSNGPVAGGDPATTLRDVRMWRSGADGAVEGRLAAPVVTWDEAADRYVFETPQVDLPPGSDRPAAWRLAARSAQANGALTRVHLAGDVRADRAAGGGESALSIRTEAVVVYPEKDRLEGKSRIRIARADGHWIEGRGFEATLAPDFHARLLAEVTSHHVPKRHAPD